MGLTKYRKKILEAIGKDGSGINVASTKLGLPQINIDNTLTKIYRDFKELLGVIDDYNPVFSHRLKKDEKELYSILRRLARKVKEK